MSSPSRNVSAAQRATAFAQTILGGVEAPSQSPSAAVETPSPLDASDRFSFGEVIGEGGMGAVLEATDRSFGRRVAWKQLRAEARSPELVRRFVVEATVTANLEHPGVVPVHERGVRDGVPYYVMRRLDGRTLGEALSESKGARGRLALLPVVMSVAHTLAYAHERGVIHRDIKPENVIVGAHGEVTVIDWGIARVRELERLAPWVGEGATQEAPTSSNETLAGSILGTPAYMAPEQAKGARDEIDERTDVFALGALLYHVLAGRPPYEGTSMMEVVGRAMQGAAPPLAKVAPEAPAPLVAICERAMQVDRAARFASASDFADALEGAVTGSLGTKASWWVRALSGAATVLVALLAVAAVGIARSVLPEFHLLGAMGYPVVALGLLGGALSVVEYTTRGRHALVPRVRRIAALSAAFGLAGSLLGSIRVFERLSDEKLAADATAWRATLGEGAYEALGSVTLGTVTAIVVLVAAEIASSRSLASTT